MSTKDIFLSYGREPEVIQFVTQLKCDLESHGFGVWLDVDDIPAGSDWHGAIGRGLHQCRALIAVITKKYVNSRFCSSELYTADGDRKLIFPVIFEEVNFGASDTGMGVKYVISGINWSMFRPRIDNYVASLYKLIEGLKEKGLGSVSSKDSSYLHDQLLQMHSGPCQLGTSATPTLEAASSFQATPSLSLKSGLSLDCAGLTVPSPPSPPPKYSEVFPTTYGTTGTSAATSMVRGDAKAQVPLSAMFVPALVGSCLVAAPTPVVGCGDPAAYDVSRCAGNPHIAIGAVDADHLSEELVRVTISRDRNSLTEVGGALVAATNGRMASPVASLPASFSGDITMTTGAHGMRPAESRSIPDPIETDTDPISLVAQAGSQPLTAVASNVSPPDTPRVSSLDGSKKNLPETSSSDASNRSALDTFNRSSSDTRSLPDTFNRSLSDASNRSSPDASNRSSPDAFNRSSSEISTRSLPVMSTIATSSHHHHLSLITRPIKRIRKLRTRLRARLHHHSNPEAREVEVEEEEEEEEEGEGGMEEITEGVEDLADHKVLEPNEEGGNSVSSLSFNMPLPPMHLKGLRVRLANKLLKGALTSPAPSAPDPINHR